MRDVFKHFATCFALDTSDSSRLLEIINAALMDSKLCMLTGSRFDFKPDTVAATLNDTSSPTGQQVTTGANTLWLIVEESVSDHWKPSVSEEMALLFILIYLKDLYMADLTDWWSQGDKGLEIVLRGKPTAAARAIKLFFSKKRWNDLD
jgi:hypothetical protein